MDEPTSSLTLTETNRLLEVIADLKASGVAIIFISHRLNEVEHCADRVVVLRDGVGGRHARPGRDPARRHDPADDRPRPQGALHAARRAARRSRCWSSRASRRPPIPATAVDAQRCAAARSSAWAASSGPGRTELARAMFGIDPPRRRQPCSIDGEPIVHRARRATPSTAASISCPEDRKQSGLILDDSIAENISLREPARASPARSWSAARPRSSNAEEQRKSLRIKTPDVDDARRLAVRRQPAEGRARQVAVDAAQGHDLRRADARHRRRLEGRDLRADARARRRAASPS